MEKVSWERTCLFHSLSAGQQQEQCPEHQISAPFKILQSLLFSNGVGAQSTSPTAWLGPEQGAPWSTGLYIPLLQPHNDSQLAQEKKQKPNLDKSRLCGKVSLLVTGPFRPFGRHIKWSALDIGSQLSNRAAGCKLHPNRQLDYSVSPVTTSYIIFVSAKLPNGYCRRLATGYMQHY